MRGYRRKGRGIARPLRLVRTLVSRVYPSLYGPSVPLPNVKNTHTPNPDNAHLPKPTSKGLRP